MNTAPITSFKGEYRFLSNFQECSIIFEGETYNSTEAAYMAAKTTDPEERRQIREAPSPAKAKALGRKVKLRADWEMVKLAVMEDLVRQKFYTHPPLAKLLLDTGDSTLIEGNTWGDCFWGVCDGAGHNHLGKILMKVRLELATLTQISDE